MDFCNNAFPAPVFCAVGKTYNLLSLQESIDYAISLAASCLYLQVNKQNTAQHFYSKHGFTIREASILDIGGGYIMDDYIMELVFNG